MENTLSFLNVVTYSGDVSPGKSLSKIFFTFWAGYVYFRHSRPAFMDQRKKLIGNFQGLHILYPSIIKLLATYLGSPQRRKCVDFKSSQVAT